MMCPVDRSYLATVFDGRGDRCDARDVHSKDRERTESVDGRKNSAKIESAAHMAVRLSRIGCPDHFVESHCSFEHYCYSSVQALPAPYAYAVPQQIRVDLRLGMRRSSHHCCSGLQVVLVAAPGIVHR